MVLAVLNQMHTMQAKELATNCCTELKLHRFRLDLAIAASWIKWLKWSQLNHSQKVLQLIKWSNPDSKTPPRTLLHSTTQRGGRICKNIIAGCFYIFSHTFAMTVPEAASYKGCVSHIHALQCRQCINMYLTLWGYVLGGGDIFAVIKKVTPGEGGVVSPVATSTTTTTRRK